MGTKITEDGIASIIKERIDNFELDPDINKKGKIIQIMGPVVDVKFDGYLPEVNEAIEVISGDEIMILEVAANIGENISRTIALNITDKLIIGQDCKATGSPLQPPPNIFNNKRRGENPLIVHVDDCAFTKNDKPRMFIVNEYKDGLVYTNHIIDYPLGSIVEFRDAKNLKGVLSGYEDDRSIITILGYEAEISKGKPFWVTDTILSTPDTKSLDKTTTIIEPRFNQDGTILSFGEQQVPTFNNEVEAICNDIRSYENLFFICPSCGYVRKTKPLTQEYNGILLEKLIENKKLVCECCVHGTTDDEHVKPTEDEMIIASFSTYNFISKFDQSVPEIVDVDETQPHGVKLGTINSFDDVNIKESSTKISEELKELMKSLKDKLGDKLGSKVNDKKLNDMIERPNQTMLRLELAEAKRKLKLAKRTNQTNDIEHFQNIYNKTKQQLDITHD